MKLSKAIRLGSKKKPQGFHAMYFNNSTCALGSALDALGVLDLVNNWAVLQSLYLFIYRVWVNCPAANCDKVYSISSFNIVSAIVHLNDWHYWSREAIAEWLEIIEDNCDQEEHNPYPEPIEPEENKKVREFVPA